MSITLDDSLILAGTQFLGSSDSATAILTEVKERLQYHLHNGGKTCNYCLVYKPIDMFAKETTRNDGLQNRCKACDKLSTPERQALRSHRTGLAFMGTDLEVGLS